MIIQQIRSATLKIRYNSIGFLVDPWLQDQGTGFSVNAFRPEMRGIRCPLEALPDTPENILEDVDYCLVTHLHFDHFSPDYLPADLKIIAQNKEDAKKLQQMGEVCSYVFEAPGEKCLYIAADTVYCAEVEQTIRKYHPEVLVLKGAIKRAPDYR